MAASALIAVSERGSPAASQCSSAASCDQEALVMPSGNSPGQGIQYRKSGSARTQPFLLVGIHGCPAGPGAADGPAGPAGRPAGLTAVSRDLPRSTGTWT